MLLLAEQHLLLDNNPLMHVLLLLPLLGQLLQQTQQYQQVKQLQPC